MDRSRAIDAGGLPGRFCQGVRSTTGFPQEPRQGCRRYRLLRQQRQRPDVVERGGVRARSHAGDRALFVGGGGAGPPPRRRGPPPGRAPVIGRFSLAGGTPHAADASATARGLGLAFGFPGGQQWRMATLNLPVFLDNSPQGFYDRLIASAVVPGTGKPDPAAMARFLAAHPETAQAMKIVKQHPPTPGFADSVYRGLNAFYFVNQSGARTPVRWSLTPMQQALPPSSGPDALFDALVRQLRNGPLRWRLVLTVGAAADPTHDATLPWPPDRRSVDAGMLTLDSGKTEAPGNARDINFDPLVLPPGIEPSDDPLLSARSAVYAASYRRRTGETGSPPAVQVDKVAL